MYRYVFHIRFPRSPAFFVPADRGGAAGHHQPKKKKKKVSDRLYIYTCACTCVCVRLFVRVGLWTVKRRRATNEAARTCVHKTGVAGQRVN